MNEKTVRQMMRRLIFVSLCATMVFFGTLYFASEGLKFYANRIDNIVEASQSTREKNQETIMRSIEVPTSKALPSLEKYTMPVSTSMVYRREMAETKEDETTKVEPITMMQEVTEPIEDIEVTLAEEVIEETEVVEETVPETTEESKYDGPVLTARMGINEDGPSGRESWYNLDMSGVIKIMKSLGYDYEYWIREDGVKMYGDYVMVAANLEIRPKGTILETSLGTAMVCDTGGFVKYHPYQLDIAVNW